MLSFLMFWGLRGGSFLTLKASNFTLCDCWWYYFVVRSFRGRATIGNVGVDFGVRLPLVSGFCEFESRHLHQCLLTSIIRYNKI